MSVSTPRLIGPFCAVADFANVTSASASPSDLCVPLRADPTETCILFPQPQYCHLGQNGASGK